MKILFMGTPDFAVPCLEAIYYSKHKIISVVTQPDKPKGRGKKVLPTPVKIRAMELGLDVLQPQRIKEKSFIETLKKMDIDCIVVVAYGQILPIEILNLPVKGCINVHASLLPKYRGAAPINWAIINGEKKTGITTMYMNEGLDTGDMILKDEIIIDNYMTAGELHDKLASLGAKTLMKTLNLIEEDKAPRISQNEAQSSYAYMLDKKMGLIDWEKPAENIHNLVRGLNPWPGAYTNYKGKKLKVWKSKVINQNCEDKHGKIIKVDKYGIYVCTQEKILLIEELQFPNGKKMSVDDYIRGNNIETGVVLGE